MSKHLCLPYFGIQPDWEDAVRGGKCWVSYRKYGDEKSVHGELQGGGDVPVGSDPFTVEKDKSGSRFVTVSVKDEGKRKEAVFVAPSSILNGIHKKGIIALDVAEGGLGVSVCTNNELKVWEAGSGNVRRVLQGHPVDAYHCRWFPSGIVVLSGGADCCLKIWSAEDGSCPVTLKGHKAAVHDTSVVERGRNIVSVGKDASAKLWDCGESKCLDTLYKGESSLNACLIMTPTKFGFGTPIANMSEREVLTKGKLLILGSEDGKIIGIDVAARKEVFSLKVSSAVNRVIQIGYNAFAAGCQNGDISIFKLENLKEPLVVTSAAKSPILDLLAHPSSKKGDGLWPFWACKTDGSCAMINPTTDSEHKLVFLSGSNCDPVYQIKADLDFIFTSCRDGLIRKYSLKVINRLL